MEMNNFGPLMNSLKRGLTSYISYMATCSMSEVYSEYLLYEPALRILMTKNCEIYCEFGCDGLSTSECGDKKRIDFVGVRNENQFAIELKWAKSKKPNFSGDIEKLVWFKENYFNPSSYLCVFGRMTELEGMLIPPNFRESGKPVYSDLGLTKYGCRIFVLA
ncbi:MAG: hypothetical protein AB3N10_09515 [Allomuricauda sp.]